MTRYPWAAHYLPVPGSRSTLVRELMQDLGVLRGGDWEERHLCFSPQERLFLHGRWQEGIEPELAATSRDRADFRRFQDLIAEQRSSGEFTIPMELGAKLSPLDAITMKDWLARHRLTSPYLHWYVDYACRDDYGASSGSTSAWAGVHYFAAREHDEKGPLTWPEGNGWIAEKLISRVKSRIHTNAPVVSIRRNGTSMRVMTPSVEYVARQVIFAAPSFLSRYVLEGAYPVPFEYSPWITANLTLDRLPREKGSEPAWDNVIYDSPSLGYVVATHMSLRTHRDASVWTWYHALVGGGASEQRRSLLQHDWSYWKEFILRDLERAHPDIRECVSRIDLMRMGHAMVRPTPGSIFSHERQRLVRGLPGVTFANADLSGFSVFEEAQYRGVAAADKVLKRI
ncbi:MAG TPA: hypothetical protein VEQ63_15410 [Bryobacteraceae bacterium]|nr:hypothetical protein [Bryobacteraceae bacterium]